MFKARPDPMTQQRMSNCLECRQSRKRTSCVSSRPLAAEHPCRIHPVSQRQRSCPPCPAHTASTQRRTQHVRKHRAASLTWGLLAGTVKTRPATQRSSDSCLLAKVASLFLRLSDTLRSAGRLHMQEAAEASLSSNLL